MNLEKMKAFKLNYTKMTTFCSTRIPYSICLVKVQTCCIPHPLQSILSKYVRLELCGHFRRTIFEMAISIKNTGGRISALFFIYKHFRSNVDLSLWFIRMKLHMASGKPVSVDSLTPAMWGCQSLWYYIKKTKGTILKQHCVVVLT